MRLLFDENISPHLTKPLSDLYPNSLHVRDAGLSRASDEDVWEYASSNGLAIASKDSDFRQRSFLYGQPPKVIWVRKGNCSTADIESLLRTQHQEILLFENDPNGALLILE